MGPEIHDQFVSTYKSFIFVSLVAEQKISSLISYIFEIYLPVGRELVQSVVIRVYSGTKNRLYRASNVLLKVF